MSQRSHRWYTQDPRFPDTNRSQLHIRLFNFGFLSYGHLWSQSALDSTAISNVKMYSPTAMQGFISSHFQPSFLLPTIFVKKLYFMNWPLEIATESYAPTRTSYTSGHVIKITLINGKKLRL